MPAALPVPVARVARMLIARGGIEHAVVMLKATAERDPRDAEARELLRAIERDGAAEARADEVAAAFAVDLGLAHAYVGAGLLVEALALLRGTELGRTADGRALRGDLEAVLAPIPQSDVAALSSVHGDLLRGRARDVCERLDAVALADRAAPGWVARRATLLAKLLGRADDLDEHVPGDPGPREVPPEALAPSPSSSVSPELAAEIALSQGDIVAARAELEALARAYPDNPRYAARLASLRDHPRARPDRADDAAGPDVDDEGGRGPSRPLASAASAIAARPSSDPGDADAADDRERPLVAGVRLPARPRSAKSRSIEPSGPASVDPLRPGGPKPPPVEEASREHVIVRPIVIVR